MRVPGSGSGGAEDVENEDDGVTSTSGQPLQQQRGIAVVVSGRRACDLEPRQPAAGVGERRGDSCARGWQGGDV